MARKIIPLVLILIGGLGVAVGLALGHVVIEGGYMEKPFAGGLGHIAGMLMVATGFDYSITTMFWGGTVCTFIGWRLWPRNGAAR